MIGLALLAVVTAGLVVLAMLHVRPTDVTAVPQSAAPSPTEPTIEPAPTPTPTVTPISTATMSPRPSKASTATNIRSLLRSSNPIKIVIMGDASGIDDATTERWVTQWAKELSASRTVTVRSTGPTGEYGEPQTYGSAGGVVEIFNASDPSGRLATATGQADQLIPADTDLVIISFGHNEGAGPMSGKLDGLWAEIPQGTMGLAIAQNPVRGDAANDQRAKAYGVTDWARQRAIASVNVFDAFIAAPEPLDELLGSDRTNPSTAGSKVWKDAIVAAVA